MARAIDATVGDGLLLVDKPAGWSSHQVVGACRRLAGTRKAGHAGTLDPMATGLLLVGVNKATRLLTFFVGCDKTYQATIRLGAQTFTDDAEGEIVSAADPAEVGRLAADPARVDAAIAGLRGDIEQVPSAVSAIRVGGKRAYARARAGEDVELAARPVHVARFDVRARRAGDGVLDLDVEADVSSGTYVRALARDLGRALGVGGHLIALRRTRIGDFGVAAASTMEQLEAARSRGTPRERGIPGVTEGTSGLPLVPMAQAARAVMPVRQLDAGSAALAASGVRIPSEQPGRPGPVAAVGPDGKLIAVLDESGPAVRLEAVLA